ncbi:hypothetical protein L484_002968 [Morus notabilis]|uniref:Uncharacterized protein n=1 Tax=Morus notabilis TaxID=981085 RepID=W9RDE4_9ROSA|nr:hypothetical protein L484_002968 [Morus notabilis]
MATTFGVVTGPKIRQILRGLRPARGRATNFGVVTGPISRYIEVFFTMYDWHGNGDNFWCRNRAHQPLYRSSLRNLQLARDRRQLLVS